MTIVALYFTDNCVFTGFYTQTLIYTTDLLHIQTIGNPLFQFYDDVRFHRIYIYDNTIFALIDGYILKLSDDFTSAEILYQSSDIRYSFIYPHSNFIAFDTDDSSGRYLKSFNLITNEVQTVDYKEAVASGLFQDGEYIYFNYKKNQSSDYKTSIYTITNNGIVKKNQDLDFGINYAFFIKDLNLTFAKTSRGFYTSRGREAGSGIISESLDEKSSSENGFVQFSNDFALKWGDANPSAQTVVDITRSRIRTSAPSSPEFGDIWIE